MQIPVEVFPAGSTIPPPGLLLTLLIGLVAVGFALRRVAPRVTDRVVVAFAPWMVAGSSCYVLYQIGAVPRSVAPLFGSPAVYASIAVLAGATWAATAAIGMPADRWRLPSVPGIVAFVGGVVAVVAAGWALLVGARRGLTIAWPAAGLVVAVAVSGVTWAGVRRLVPATRLTGGVGALAVFGHALDGVSTAVGIDILGFGEQSPISRAIIAFTADLPATGAIGTGWLFVVLKLALAAVVVVLFSGYVREEPTEGYLLLGAVAAVGLGPGVHNLLLFTIASP